MSNIYKIENGIKKIYKKPELLIPAGDIERLKIAFLYGADAVFIGGQQLGLRSNAKNFDIKDIINGVNIANKYNGKVYVTTNIIPHEENLHIIDDYLINLEKAGVKGIIVADLYIIQRAKEIAPKLEIHISTQTSITNIKTVEFYKKIFQANRVVLARELTLEEIQYISKNIQIELEIFIHGALCIAYSGRCTLSNHMTCRDSNRGGCCQSCRWEYEFLDENKKKYKDKHTPFSMNPKDLNLIRNITKLIDLGIDSFKVEGRMRSIHYVATTTSVYRNIIDKYCENPDEFKINTKLIEELQKCANRSTSEGFFTQQINHRYQIYENRSEYPNKEFIGVVKKYFKKEKLLKIEQRNYFSVGDNIEILQPNGKSICFEVKSMYNEKLENIKVARHPQETIFIPINIDISKYSLIRKRNMGYKNGKSK